LDGTILWQVSLRIIQFFYDPRQNKRGTIVSEALFVSLGSQSWAKHETFISNIGMPVFYTAKQSPGN
jgi:hypothetical protein